MKTSLLIQKNAKKVAGLFVLIIATSLITIFAYTKLVHPLVIITSEQPPITHLAQLTPGSANNTLDFTYAAEKTVHAVVHVKTTSTQSASSGGSFYDFFFGDRIYDQKPQPVS